MALDKQEGATMRNQLEIVVLLEMAAAGEWDPWWNRLTGVRVRQPPDRESRREQARVSRQRIEYQARLIVDEMDDAVWRNYGAASSPAFVIDLKGLIAARQVWIEPKKIRQVLERLLAESDGRGAAINDIIGTWSSEAVRGSPRGRSGRSAA